MANNGEFLHVVVTPSRDELDFLPALVDSMVSQTLPPSEWVIVSHNSGEEAMSLLEEASEKYNWITIIPVDDLSKRKRGAQIAKLVNLGLSEASSDWAFFSKIDSDMILPEDYFEKIISNFLDSEKLGITSGSCFILSNGRKVIEKVSKDHTRGGLKTYRRSCFDDIGGIRELDGWDGIDNIMAQMEGWDTHSFQDPKAQHQRRTGSHSGLVSGCFESGKFAHAMGYFPPFMLARSLHRMTSKPILIGGFSMFIGYLFSIMSRQKRVNEPEVISFLRKKQKNRLKPW
jgi:glycosyltransferase involved in cell wall biosynthesis